jgi:hypothetical protein
VRHANRFACVLVLGAALLSPACGYHVAGKTDLLPKEIKTIAIPAFGNVTTRYKLTDRIPAALTREFLSRTRYRVIADPNEADAVLSGAIVNFFSYPTVFDPNTGRAAGVQMSVFLQVQLQDRKTGAMLFQRPNMEFKQRYEISVDQVAYFEESDVALARLSQEVARTLVSAILENF